jgi:hypothetical protein
MKYDEHGQRTLGFFDLVGIRLGKGNAVMAKPTKHPGSKVPHHKRWALQRSRRDMARMSRRRNRQR